MILYYLSYVFNQDHGLVISFINRLKVKL